MHRLLALLLIAAPAARALDVRFAPEHPHPGDPILVTVVDAKAPPTATLAGRPLRFWHFSEGFRAITALPVEQAAGPAPLHVEAAGVVLDRTVDVAAAEWRDRELKVAKAFTKPSRAQERRMAADKKAFAAAWEQAFGPPRFTTAFQTPREAAVTAPFGDRRMFNGKVESQHFGLDLDGRLGQPVSAANDGRVVMVRNTFSAGNVVLLDHGADVFTAYFHLSKTEVKPGQLVKRGARIGKVGKTGRVTGPHLHFGTRVDGLYVDPAALLALPF